MWVCARTSTDARQTCVLQWRPLAGTYCRRVAGEGALDEAAVVVCTLLLSPCSAARSPVGASIRLLKHVHIVTWLAVATKRAKWACAWRVSVLDPTDTCELCALDAHAHVDLVKAILGSFARIFAATYIL
jgi:hypothetical protein